MADRRPDTGGGGAGDQGGRAMARPYGLAARGVVGADTGAAFPSLAPAWERDEQPPVARVRGWAEWRIACTIHPMETLRRLWTRLTGTGGGRATLAAAALLCLTLAALSPLLAGSLPESDDGLQHFYRLIGFDYSVGHGDLWPRYAPGLAFGYGLPIFNYYSPLSLYPVELLHLAGLGFLDAMLAGLALYTLLGAAGAYLLGRAWGGIPAGLAAAAAYAYAPYTLLNWTRRMALAEFLALALLAWAMWAFWRAARRGRGRDVLLAAALFAALIVAHHLTALVAAGLLALYAILLGWTAPDRRAAVARLALAYGGALGLAAFFWMPALFQQGYVQLDRIRMEQPVFQTLGEVFAAPRPADLTEQVASMPRSYGWPQIALTLIAAAALLVRRRGRPDAAEAEARRWLIYALPLLALLTFMVTPASLWLWQAVPLIDRLQFAWRLVGPASLLLAVGAGLGAALIVRRLARTGWQIAWVAAVIAALMLNGLPWLYVRYLPAPPGESIVDAQAFERRTGLIGGTSNGEYLPRWSTELPDPDRLAGLFAAHEIIPRLQPAPGITLTDARWGIRSAELAIEAGEGAALVFDWLYFPGWRAWLDGDPLPVGPVGPEGFVGVEVPAGAHTLRVALRPTPLALAATAFSAASLILLAAAAARLRARRPAPPEGDAARAGVWIAAAALAGLAVFGAKTLWIDHAETPFKRARFAGGVEAGVEVPVLARFGGEITLLGFDLSDAQARPGEPVEIALYWTLLGESASEGYSSNAAVLDAAGQVIYQMQTYQPGGVSSVNWQPGLYVRDVLTLPIPPGTPPGDYTIVVGLYSHELGRNLDVVNAAGQPVGVTAPLTTISVTAPRHPLRAADVQAEVMVGRPLIPALTLIGSTAPPAEAEVGQTYPVAWFWGAAAAPDADYEVRVLWLDPAGRVAGESRRVPPVTGWPTSAWRPGDLWRGVHTLHVPGSLEAGVYDVAVVLVDATGQAVGERAVLGRVTVSTPPRRYHLPEMQARSDAVWANGIGLAGYDLSAGAAAPGGSLTLTLYWQPAGVVQQSLTVFVHLVDANGELVAQRDQTPGGGARPTLGWAPGEVIADIYELAIGARVPPGEYRLRVGWYNAATGQRVPLDDGGEFLTLPEGIEIGP